MNNSIEFDMIEINKDKKPVLDLMNKWMELIHSKQNKTEETPYVSSFNIKDNKINITITVDNEEQIKEIEQRLSHELFTSVSDNNLNEDEKDKQIYKHRKTQIEQAFEQLSYIKEYEVYSFKGDKDKIFGKFTDENDLNVAFLIEYEPDSVMNTPTGLYRIRIEFSVGFHVSNMIITSDSGDINHRTIDNAYQKLKRECIKSLKYFEERMLNIAIKNKLFFSGNRFTEIYDFSKWKEYKCVPLIYHDIESKKSYGICHYIINENDEVMTYYVDENECVLKPKFIPMKKLMDVKPFNVKI